MFFICSQTEMPHAKPSQFAADQQMTEDQARRIALGIARLPTLLGSRTERSGL